MKRISALPVLGLTLFASASLIAADPGAPAATPAAATASAPVVIISAPKIELTRTDGGLAPVVGAQNFGVFRASKAQPELAEGKGYTYNHHPDLAVWKGRFYLGFDSGAKDEDTWPARELYCTSTDGRTWSTPTELFPEGLSVPMRLYFFHAPNGRMLAFAGLRIDHEKTDEDTKGPLIGREIRADHSLGPIFTLRAPTGAPRPQDPPTFTSTDDAALVEAFRQLLAARVTLETQDLGVLLDPAQRMSWHNAANWPAGKLGNGFWKAPSFYHRADGAIVGIGKAGWTSLSTDNGATWSQPVVPPSLITNNAKVWGQRLADGRYALVYNPTYRPRYPLALVTGSDGTTFGDMRAVQTDFPPQRYPGINKNTGLQYIRGIAEWANDGTIKDTQHALWLCYSANKEDIWVSRVPVPIPATANGQHWNLYVPKWASITEGENGATAIETREPFDHAEVARMFAPVPEVTTSLTLTTPPAGPGAIDVELLAGAGGARPVRLRFTGDGFLRVIDRDKMVEFGHFAPGTKLQLSLQAQCAPKGLFTVLIDGQKVGQAQFAEATPALERLVVRVWARADVDRAPVFLPATAAVSSELDRPTTAVSTTISGVTIK